ncbi:MAG TPA: hypothetical protein VMI54_07325 [Polyangiaceae bacterium]|nr:hypothetical protein [Polyangiaceae bacterium]
MAPMPAAAPPPPAPPVGNNPLEGPQPITSKWATTFYGFAEFDAINDSTQSFNDAAGNAAIIKKPALGGKNDRTTFGMRNSRIGFKLTSPEYHGIKASGVVEGDFLGNQPPTATEQQLFSSPTFRVRHFALKVETPVVDMMFGQYWALFGWQAYFDPNTVEIQGVPGEVFSRTAQARISKTIKSGDTAFDIAVAAVRPPQRDSGVPDGQAGLKFTYGGWKGVHTVGSAGTQADGLAIGVSGVMRRFIVPNFNAEPTGRKGKTGMGISIDALLPVVPGTLENRANSLTLTGSFVTGTGIADEYTGLTGGVAFPALPNPSMANPAPTYTSDIDPGLVTFDSSGGLHTINWQSYIIGAQYFLPIPEVWISANYSHMKSSNATRYVSSAGAAKIFDKSHWWDVNLFYDMTKAVRFGGEFAQFMQTYGDGKDAKNNRFQFSAFYIF